MDQVGTVLVVDDVNLTRKTVASLAQKLGYSVIEAAGGEEALRLIEEAGGRIDVVVSDVVMPGIDGLDLMEMIHAGQPDLPVILMTAFSDINMLIRAININAFHLILKPVDRSLLKKALARALKHKRLMDLEKNYLATLERTVEEKTAELQCRMQELQEAKAVQAEEQKALKELFHKVQTIKQEWERTLDCLGDMVILADFDGAIRRCNGTFRDFIGKTYQEILGRKWEELFSMYSLTTERDFTPGAELFHAPTGRWFVFNAYPFRNDVNGLHTGTVITVHDTTELKSTMDALHKAYSDLQSTQDKVLQNEKMASIGLLAAGVAHEINNPIGFVSSNLRTLGKYQQRLLGFIDAQNQIVGKAADEGARRELEDLRKALKIEFILKDVEKLIAESVDGTDRVKKIVQDLKTFSRVDSNDFREMDLHECLESAITIVWNELKYKATLHRKYGDVPCFRAYPQQLNQVFMNLLINASHAIQDRGEITVATWPEGESVMVGISDTGCGIAPENLGRIFDPFFTTKEVGKGTGLGLSISYEIIKKHNGEISVQSEKGKGTTFFIRLPLVQETDG